MMELTGRGRGRGHLCRRPGVSLPLFLEQYLVLSRRRQRPPQLLTLARRPYLLCAQRKKAQVGHDGLHPSHSPRPPPARGHITGRDAGARNRSAAMMMAEVGGVLEYGIWYFVL
jgi:hypothetical protein